MPPRRRAAAAAQSTISFGSQSRVTKPSAKQTTTLHKGKKLDDPANLPAKSKPDAIESQIDSASESTTPVVTELVVRQQPSPSRKDPQPAEDKLALSLTKKDLNKYWEKKEGAWKPVRIHEADVKLEEKILRNFDLSIDYGPCVGIGRLDRWRRAARMGLEPPIEVLTVLLKGEDISESSHMEKLIS
ncbi:hypothetical protein N7478_012980 [Penicillium angulare]|uniref:uncharacterized protein n=1 Tax=Penicillium angulare TaxID=116970 RepID=UPI0025415ACC|nr:uncharacterized protein N7478_012980 [Penicillium angulare]KAJ5256876.1 hypothetical protein N7478_012980 [Penicillium angulare]